MDDSTSKKQAAKDVVGWFQSLKTTGGFGPVDHSILQNGRNTFESERVSDAQTLRTMKSFFDSIGYILDPHSSIGVTAAERSISRVDTKIPHISLATAHPAKFSAAVELALQHESGFNFEEKVLPSEFVGLLQKPERVTIVDNSWQRVRDIVKKKVMEELNGEI
jgi:threonine synthase